MDMLNFLKKLKKGKTIIMVTHDASTSKYAQRTSVLKDGKIVQTIKNY